MDQLKKQTLTGFLWSAIERFASQGIQFVLGIVIARLLIPSDYGLIAMLTIFIAVAQTFVESGFGTALIQKKDRTEADLSTAFYFNFIVSVVCYLALFFSAPLIAHFYKEEQLIAVTRIFGLTLIISSVGLIQWVKLNIALDFKKLAIASLVNVTISGLVGIYMAYKGFGVWALVAQTLMGNIVQTVMLWILTHWRPIWIFSRDSFNALFAFGSKILLSSLLHTIYANIYTLVIGKVYAPNELGLFNRSQLFAQFPSGNITNIFIRVIYPIQCQLQDDNDKLTSHFLRYQRLSCYIIFPITIGLCVLAEPFIMVLLGEKWLPAVPYLQILCIANMWDPVGRINGSVINAKGRSDYFFNAELIKKVAAVIILVATIPFGIRIMCYGLILYAFADVYIIAVYTRKLLNLSILDQVKSLLPVLSISVLMGAASYSCTFLGVSSLMQLLLGTLTGIVVFFGLSWLFKFREFEFVSSYLNRKKQN
jgi:teichuronic acid exporter